MQSTERSWRACDRRPTARGGHTLAWPLVLAVLGLSCATAGTESPGPPSAEVRTELQRRSLATVFFSGGGQPPPPDRAERSELRARWTSARPFERRELKRYVPDRDLRLLAIRDTDGDGVHDFRVSDYHGKFMEGDVDLDGDGIRNTLDAAPYDGTRGGFDDDGDGAPDRGFEDRDSDGIPDHVDWSGEADGETARLQEELFRGHRVLLVARGASFSPTMARSARDALTRVFQRRLAEGDLPTLRQIASDETCLLTKELDDGTNAMVVPQTQTLLVYRVGLDYPPLAQLGLLTHELSHSWQFALDFEADDLAAENRRVYSASPRFDALVEPLGWSAVPEPYDPAVDDYRLFTPQYHTLGPTYRFRGETLEAWADKLAALEEEVGETYLEDPRAGGIVGAYSMTSPGEWHADNLLAYLYTSLEERATETVGADEAAAMIAALRGTARAAWPGFRYQNFDRERLGDHYRRHFPLAESDLDYFVESYLRPAAAERSAGDSGQ